MTSNRRPFNAGARAGLDESRSDVRKLQVDVAAAQANIRTAQAAIVVLDAATNFAENETPGGVIDGVNDTFTLAHTPIGPIQLFKGAAAPSSLALQLPGGAEYTLSGAGIVYVAASIPAAGNRHRVWYRY